VAESYDASIPRCLAPGDYLIRIQQIAIHNPGSPPQFYISCAQVKVTGGGSTVPPGVSIPGAFKASDPGLTANVSFGSSLLVLACSAFGCVLVWQGLCLSGWLEVHISLLFRIW